jgi:hypothetical protein
MHINNLMNHTYPEVESILTNKNLCADKNLIIYPQPELLFL